MGLPAARRPADGAIVGISKTSLANGLVFAWTGDRPSQNFCKLNGGSNAQVAGVGIGTNIETGVGTQLGTAVQFAGGAEGASDINFGALAETAGLHQGPFTAAVISTVDAAFGTNGVGAWVCHSDANNDRGFNIYSDSNSWLRLELVRPSNGQWATASGQPNVGDTVQFIMSYDGGATMSTAVKCAVNGAFVSSNGTADPSGSTGAATAESLYIGRNRAPLGSSHNGRIALVLLWNRVLTNEEFSNWSADPWSVFRVAKTRILPAAASGAMTASVSGTGTTSSTLTGAGALAATVTGTGTSSATLTGAGALSSTVTGTGTISATLTGAGALAAATTATGTVSSTLTGAGALAASTSGTGTVSSTLTGAGALAAAVTGTGTVSGTTVCLIASDTTGTGTVSAALTGSGAVAAATAGTGTVSATLMGAGALAAATTATGSVSATLAGAGVLAADTAATGSTSSTLTGAGALASTATGTGTVSSTLTGAGALAASTTGTGTITGSFDVGLVANTTGTGTVSGTLAGAGALASTTAATGSVSATLTGAGALAATVTGTGTSSATLTGAGALAATTTSTGTIAGTATGAGALTAATTATGTLTGSFDSGVSASTTATGTVSGTLTGAGALASTVTGTSTASATLLGAGAFASTVTGTGSVSAALTGAGALAAATTGTGTVAATLKGAGALAFTVTGTGTISATPKGNGALVSTATGTGTVAATLKGAGALAATVTGTGTASLSSSGTIIPADRLAQTNWQNSGMLSVGGIPNRTTIYTTLAAGNGTTNDSPRIQTALDACPAGQVVLLAAGTFVVNDLLLIHTGITLRGAGAGQTILRKTDGAHARSSTVVSGTNGILTPVDPGSYSYDSSPLIIVGPSRWPGPDQGVSQNLTANAAQGATSVTIANASGYAAGQFVLIDELSGASWQAVPTGFGCVNNATPTPCPPFVWQGDRVAWNMHWPTQTYQDDNGNSNSGGPYDTTPGTPPDAMSWFCRTDRPTCEIKEIASVSGNTITFTSPLTISYRTSHTAQLTQYIRNRDGSNPSQQVKNAGVEKLTTIGGADGSIRFESAAYCWAKNVEVTQWIGEGVAINNSFRVEVRDSYLHTGSWPTPGGAGYALSFAAGSSECLIENNIHIDTNKVMVFRSCGAGSVVGYNYADDGWISYNPDYIECGINASHMAGPHHVLFEGNYSFNIDSDYTHGNSIYLTFLRNSLVGVRRSFPGDASNNKRTVGLAYGSWWDSMVGNVLGRSGAGNMSGYQYTDQAMGCDINGNNCSGNGTAWYTAAIWSLGYDPERWDMYPDQQVLNTVIRDGNYDYLTNTVKWHNTPATFTIPNSLYLSAKPAFFGSNAWPWVDPIGSTKTATLPAKARFDAGTPNDVSTGLVASLSGTGTVTATLKGTGALAAVRSGTGTLTGTLTTGASGSVSAATTATGTVSATLKGAGALTSTATGTGTVSATLKGAGALAAATTGTGTVTATLKGAGAVAGTTSGTGTVSATLAGSGAIAVATTGTGTLAGSLASGTTASLLGTGSVSATLGGTGALAAATTGTGAVAATPKGAGILVAATAATGSVAATLVAAGALAASAAAAGTVSATLQGTGALAAPVAGTGTATATLSGTGIVLAAALTATGTTSSTLRGTANCFSTTTATGAAAGSLTATGSLAATVAGTGTFTSTLTGAGTFAAATTATGTVTSTLTASGALAAATTATGSLQAITTGSVNIAATLAASSAITAALKGAGALAADTSGIVVLTGTGSLTTARATLTSTASLAGALGGLGTLTAATTATASVTGTFLIGVPVRPVFVAVGRSGIPTVAAIIVQVRGT